MFEGQYQETLEGSDTEEKEVYTDCINELIIVVGNWMELNTTGDLNEMGERAFLAVFPPRGGLNFYPSLRRSCLEEYPFLSTFQSAP